jgi:hypothetical protein
MIQCRENKEENIGGIINMSIAAKEKIYKSVYMLAYTFLIMMLFFDIINASTITPQDRETMSKIVNQYYSQCTTKLKDITYGDKQATCVIYKQNDNKERILFTLSNSKDKVPFAKITVENDKIINVQYGYFVPFLSKTFFHKFLLSVVMFVMALLFVLSDKVVIRKYYLPITIAILIGVIIRMHGLLMPSVLSISRILSWFSQSLLLNYVLSLIAILGFLMAKLTI